MIGIHWGNNDTYDATQGDPDWEPLGSPLTNTMRMSVTPAFPSYPSGHATLGTAAMLTVKNMLDISDDFTFNMVSAEMDGEARNQDGSMRPRLEQTLTIPGAIEQNKVSRVYLGVHWHLDCLSGSELGQDVASKVAKSFPHKV